MKNSFDDELKFLYLPHYICILRARILILFNILLYWLHSEEAKFTH